MLKEKLMEDLKGAMKAGDQFKVEVIRGTMAGIQSKAIENRGAGLNDVLTDPEIEDVLRKEVKKRKDSATMFQAGGRADLAEKELKEIEVLAAYLPKELDAAELELKVKAIVEAVNSKDFPTVIKEVMTQLKGQADGKTISELVKKLLQ